MEPTKPQLPSEAIELYNLFIHGEISRRAFMDGVQKFAVGGLAVATIIEALMPNYALGQQVSKTDDRIKATYETVPSPQGNGSIKGYLVRPASADTRSETPTKLPGIIVVHENRGLNPHIEDIARRLALRELHGVCAGWTHLPRRLPRRRLPRRPDVRQGRRQEDGRGFCGLRDVAESRAPTAPARSASPVSATAAASRIPWPSGWGPI